MTYINVQLQQKLAYNKTVNHPLQAFEWGEFRKKTHIDLVRKAIAEKTKYTLSSGFQLTIHAIPYLPFKIGYLPKGDFPTASLIEELRKIGRENNCVFIKLEPNVLKTPQSTSLLKKLPLSPAAHPLFTQFTFMLDLTRSEEELLKNMHPKTRYNIKVAKRYGVTVQEDNSEEAFKAYLELTEQTTKRQKFYAHTKQYHQHMWDTLKPSANKQKENSLTAHLLTATYQGKIITAWILFVFKDTLYYPYGASSTEYKEVMASTLMMWEVIRFGKKLGLSTFDMWGCLGENPDPHDPWFGFHRFKKGFGPNLVEFVGSYDLVLNPSLYTVYKLADKLRGKYLQIKRIIS